MDHSVTKQKSVMITEERSWNYALSKLFIANTFYRHNLTKIKTRYCWNSTKLEEAIQIDFILLRQSMRLDVTVVIPNATADADHRPVVILIKRNSGSNVKVKHHKASTSQR